MSLPFLTDSNWPISKEPEERVANPSHDTQLQDHLVDEAFVSYQKADPRRFRESMTALIQMIKSEMAAP